MAKTYSSITIVDLTDNNTLIRYSANANGSGMVAAPTTETKYIGIYVGPLESPPYTAFTWSKYVGETGNGISSIVIEYAVNTSSTTQPTIGWTTDQSTLNWEFGSFMWKRTTINYSDGNQVVSIERDTGWEAANEVAEQSVVYNIVPSTERIEQSLTGGLQPATLSFSVQEVKRGMAVLIAPAAGEVAIYGQNSSFAWTAINISNFSFSSTTKQYSATSTFMNTLKAGGANYTYVAIKFTFTRGGYTVEKIVSLNADEDIKELAKVQSGEVIIADGRVYADAIVANAITSTKIATGAIIADKIAADAIQSKNGYTLDANNIFTTSGSLLHLGDAADPADNGSIHFQNFAVDTEGNAYLNGTINAIGGQIGNLTIENINNIPDQIGDINNTLLNLSEDKIVAIISRETNTSFEQIRTDINEQSGQISDIASGLGSKVSVSDVDSKIAASETATQDAINAAKQEAITESTTKIEATANGLRIDIDTSTAPLRDDISDLQAWQQNANIWLQFQEDGLTIGKEGSDLKFRADNQELEVSNIKTTKLSLAQSMADNAEWAWSCDSQGISLKWIGGAV